MFSGLYSNLISLEFVGQKWLQTLAVIIKIVIKGNIAVIKFIPRVFLQHTNNFGCYPVFGTKHVELDQNLRCLGSGHLVLASFFSVAGQQSGSGQGHNFYEARERRQ